MPEDPLEQYNWDEEPLVCDVIPADSPVAQSDSVGGNGLVAAPADVPGDSSPLAPPTEDPVRPPPAWELRHITAVSPVLQRSDPRLELQDAPSAYTLEPPAAALQRIRRRCLLHARPTVKYHAEASFVTKEERAVLPDGTVYLLRTTWTADPTSATRRSQDTQTDVHGLEN